MRRLLVLFTVVLVGITPLSGLSVTAQENGEWVDEAWRNVDRPTPGAPLELLDEFQVRLANFGAEQQASDVQEIRDRLAQEEEQAGYVVTFEEKLAHIPEIREAELMAVYIYSGEFVLDNMGPYPFTVVPGGDGTVSTMNVEIEGENEVAHYTLIEDESGYAKDENELQCPEVCVIDPETSAQRNSRIALQLLQDDWVLLPANELCIWCLLNQNEDVGESTGTLYVYPLLAEGVTEEGFSWVQRWDSAQAGMAQGTPSTEIQATPSAQTIAPDQADSVRIEPVSDSLNWALYNPAPNCRSG